ncbi:ice-binding family protein [uncultured Jatrophihabitans sp.]|uniref:ice-binding family protein n=1 Tax=uncultured Jatrophihabitans sp. TaxID=1610747 RepID=UPI0035CBC5C5
MTPCQAVAAPGRPVGARRLGLVGVGAALSATLLAAGVATSSPAFAAAPGLGSAASYSVLAGSTATNTGTSVLSGDLGVSPGYAITGFSTAVIGGATHDNDSQAAQAESDLTTAYNVAAGLTPTGGDLGSALVGGTHDPGVYNAASALDMSGTVTLDGQGDPDSVFVFQVGSGFTSASNSHIVLTGAAQACNVFWQVGSSATLGTNSSFVGTIMALDSITVTTGTTVEGRALARNAAVTLDNNVFTASTCATTSPTTSAAPSSTGTGSGTGTSGPGTTAASTPASGSAIATAGGGSSSDEARGAQGTGRGGSVSATDSSSAHTTTSTALTTTTLASTGAGDLRRLLIFSALLVGIGLTLSAAARRRRPATPRHR